MPKKYFARANTSSGCVNLLDSNLQNIDNVCLVKGSSKFAKNELMKTAAGYFDSMGENTEYVYSPFNISQLDAVIVRDKRFALADADCCVCARSQIDTDEFIDMKRTGAEKEYLDELSEKAQRAYSALYEEYKKAKVIHDEWEKIYIANMDYDRLNHYTSGVTEQLISSENIKKDGNKYERFFGASTMDGSVNYIDNITEGLKNRYFIKGRPGTGKSTFLKKLAKAALTAGWNTQVYYCSFDKDSLDMVLVPELSFCVFDSTAPHEMFPSSERDAVLDFYKEAGLTGIDEKYEKELEFIQKRYGFRVFEGVSYLRIGNGYDMEREYYLSRGLNKEEVAKQADKLVRKVMV